MLKIRILLIGVVCSLFYVTTENVFAEETKTLVWPDGTRYVGGVEDGKRSGKGTIFWQDGTRFVGRFENDQRNGPGTMILPDGTVYNGYFENDVLTDKSDVTTSSEPSAPVAEISAEDVTEIATAQLEAQQQVEATQDSANNQTETVPSQTAGTVIAAVEEPTKELPALTIETRQQVQDAIDDWAAAWSAQDVEGYLAAYADSFKVPGRQSRRQWEGMRRSRLTRPSQIDVNVIYDTFEVISENEIQVDFNQIYDSNLFSDRTNKRMVVSQEGNRWKIISETSL